MKDGDRGDERVDGEEDKHARGKHDQERVHTVTGHVRRPCPTSNRAETAHGSRIWWMRRVTHGRPALSTHARLVIYAHRLRCSDVV